MTMITGEPDVPTNSGLLPPDLTGQNVVISPGPPSPSDDPYDHSPSLRPARKGTAMPFPRATATTKGHTSATGTGEVHFQTGSMSSLHLSLNAETMSHLSNHEFSRSHSPQQGRTDDTHSINTTRTRSTRHLVSFTRHASNSRVTVNTSHSIARSIAGSESRKSAYRTHGGSIHTIHTRPFSVHSSTVGEVRHESPGMVSTPLDLPRETPAPDSRIDHNVHYTAPPAGSGEGPGSEVVMLYDGPPITAMVANDVRRYERSNPRNARTPNMTIVPATTVKFRPHDKDVPQGWTTLVHPEGARYFVNQETRTFTEMNICDEEIRDDIDYYMRYLLEELERVVDQEKLDLDMQQVDLVLEPKAFDGESVVCCYYFANHRDRCLFWLDPYDAEAILSDCIGVESLSHIRLAIQGQYWYIRVKVLMILPNLQRRRHWDYFPSLCPVTQSLVNELNDMLLHATCDHLTSRQSSAVFDLTELREYLALVEKIQVYPPDEWSIHKCHAAIIIGRIMYSFSYNHFINFHGEDCVRLNYEQSAYGWKYTPSLLMRALTFVLFFDPVIQIQELHKIYVDEIVCKWRWDAFTSKFKGQLENSNLLATVLLNANVGFLAINTVDQGGRTITQLASYMSLVTSLASIVLGLVFVSRDRACGDNTAMEAAGYLSRLHDEKHGLERLAIIYSLPKALLMWGIVFFFTAFATNWWTPGDRTSRAVVGAVTLTVFVSLLYGIIRTLDKDVTLWGTTKDWLDRSHIHRELLSHLAGARKKFMEFMGMEGARSNTIQEPQSRAEQGNDFEMGTPRSFTQANIEANAAMYDTFHPESPAPPDQRSHSTPHDDTSILPDSHTHTEILLSTGSLQQIQENAQTIFHEQSTAVAHSAPHDSRSPVTMSLTKTPPLPDQRNYPDTPELHDNTSILPSSDLHTNTGMLPGPGPLQQVQEQAQTISHAQSTADLHPMPHENYSPVNMPLTTSPCSAPEGMIKAEVRSGMDSDASSAKAANTYDLGGLPEAVTADTSPPIPSGPLFAEELVVEEPEEVAHSQSSRSSTPPPKIYAKSATADYFHHAPAAAKWTLQHGYDIEECKD